MEALPSRVMNSRSPRVNALPSRVMNSRSPRVVSSPRMPRRCPPPGLRSSRIVIPTRASAMQMKNAAVGQVQAIHDRDMP